MKNLLMIVFVGVLVAGCSGIQAEPSHQVVPVSEVQWEKLNPARGDQSPQAGTLWGDRNGTEPTGFLAKFVDGFSSPPHIHNTTYRAVVISGLVHNDDPEAADMWMPTGSFWTQPEGEVHITAAKGVTNIALVEIDMGPYLVLPPKEAFDNGERPINVDASNIIWLDPPEMQASSDGPQVAYLWGDVADGQPRGTFVRFPAGFEGKIHGSSPTFRAVVIKGQIQYHGDSTKVLDPGSYFSSTGEWAHQVSLSKEAGAIIYVRSNGSYRLTSSRD